MALLYGVMQMGAAYFLGIGFYASRFPEVVFPKTFDIFGSSHQLWHACVILAACITFAASLRGGRSCRRSTPRTVRPLTNHRPLSST